MMEVKIESNNLLTEGCCHLCQKEFQLDIIGTVFYIKGERQGDLCDDCFKLVARGIKCPSLEEWEKAYNEMMRRWEK